MCWCWVNFSNFSLFLAIFRQMDTDNGEKMDLCRVCLSTEPEKDIYQLKTSKKHGDKSYSEILQVCLDIQVSEDSKITKKICTKCFKKVLTFYKFKSMALKNDAYLRSLHSEVCSKFEPNAEEVLVDIATAFITDSVQSNVKYEFNYLDEESMAESPMSVHEYKASIKVESRTEKDHKEELTGESESSETKDLDLAVPENATRPPVTNKGKKKPKTDNISIPIPKTKLKNKPRYFPCKNCNKIFKGHGARSRHNKNIHLGIKDHCVICDKGVTDLATHTKVVHDQSKLKHKCEACGRRFVTQCRLRYHACQHSTSEETFACPDCDKTFRNPSGLNSHVRRVHEEEKSYMCHFCSKSFFRKSRLTNHLRTHTKEKPFKCAECDKGFSTSTGLRNHQYTHTDRQDFHCTLCDKTFASPRYLKAHTLAHSSERPHPCRYCGVAFGRSDHRNRHERTAHQKNV